MQEFIFLDEIRIEGVIRISQIVFSKSFNKNSNTFFDVELVVLKSKKEKNAKFIIVNLLDVDFVVDKSQ